MYDVLPSIKPFLIIEINVSILVCLMCMTLVDGWPFLTADDVNVILITKIDEIYSDSQRVRVLHPIVSEVGVSSLQTFKKQQQQCLIPQNSDTRSMLME